jgi:ubiquinone/menaquinone biosynthesis C-methylase UbiE
VTASPLSLEINNPAVAYEQHLVGPLFRPWAALLIQHTGISRGDTVLDVACGTGIVARLAAERSGGWRQVTGVDQSRGMLAVARQVEPEIDWREGSAGNLPLREGERFDIVLCHQALQFFPDRGAAVHQMHRALKPDGRLGIASWSPVTEGLLHDLHVIAERRLGALVDRRHAFGEEQPMKELLENAGFRQVQVETRSLRVTFPDPARFLQLNARALVGMSSRTASLSEASKGVLMAELVKDSAEAARVHTTEDGLTFSIGSVLATARR